MPCNSDYLQSSGTEKAMSQVACLLDELDGKPINKIHWNGYHPRVYNQPYDADAMVAELCSRLQDLDVTKYSLEMQMWWRDHQQADRERIEKEAAEVAQAEKRKAALAKLTNEERKLLGLELSGFTDIANQMGQDRQS